MSPWGTKPDLSLATARDPAHGGREVFRREMFRKGQPTISSLEPGSPHGTTVHGPILGHVDVSGQVLVCNKHPALGLIQFYSLLTKDYVDPLSGKVM